MSKTNDEIYMDCINRFIEMANTMKDEGTDLQVISGALMSASGLYTTYVHGGNEGGLTDSGVERVSAMYTRELHRIQKVKKAEGGK